ncbi:unnamed protein product [Musa textilis]
MIEGFGCNGLLFWATVFDAVRVVKLGYDGCVLRLEGCPKDLLVCGSKVARVWKVTEKKKGQKCNTRFFTEKIPTVKM